MRSAAILASVVVATIIAVACGSSPKTVRPDENSNMVPPDAGSDTGSGSDLGSDMGSGMGSGSDTGSGMGSDAGAGSDTGAGSGSAVAEGEDPFLARTREEKLAIMKDQVLPAMTKAFKAFDKKEFGKFGCKSCHGKGHTDKTYKMPNPGLHKLDFDKIKAGKDHPKTAEFMSTTVVPEMAAILGLPVMTDDNPKGFGCLHCHTLKQ